MTWFLGILFFFGFLFFLFRFPKQTLVLIGLLFLACFILWQAFIGGPEQERKAIENAVSVELSFNTSVCSEKYPLFVKITNNSRKTIDKVTWYLNIYVPGYSTDLSGYNDNYSCDKILKPGEVYTLCYMLPSSLDNGHPPSSLKYEVSWKRVSIRD